MGMKLQKRTMSRRSLRGLRTKNEYIKMRWGSIAKQTGGRREGVDLLAKSGPSLIKRGKGRRSWKKK